MESSLFDRITRIAAVGAALALAACGGGGNTVLNNVPSSSPGNTAPAPTLRLVGVGDSLTAGVQSGGLLGAPAANPVAGSLFGPVVPPTQGNGFWSLLWQQANGGSVLNPATSPLPLINGTGIGSILVPDAKGNPTAITTACGGTNALAFNASTALQTRINPSVTPFDLGVPGQTLHEALYQLGPETPCQLPAGLPVAIYGLSQLINSESGSFYPILGNFGPNTTQINAAASLHGTVTTMWLGSNDLLKYLFSGGAIAPTDPTAFYNDTVAAIKQLQGAGSKVAVANLIDVVKASYFSDGPRLGTVITGQLIAKGVPPATASAIAANYVAQATAQGLSNGTLLTLNGLARVLGSVAASAPVTLVPATDLVPGAFVAQVQSLNDTYNAKIAAAVTATGATLVDINSTFKAINAGGGYPINAKCCSVVYGGGLTSLDGIHPSNTGYAIIANVFIQAIDTAFGLSIAPVNVTTVYATDPFAPH